MEITEVRIKLMDDSSERLQAFCSITFDDCFVVRDLKIIEGTSGPFVAMPSRKLTSHCPGCGCKNHLRAAYCNQCGGRLKDDRAVKDPEGRAKLYADIAHPINSTCREMIQTRVIEEYQLEQERAKQPGYVSRYDDFDAEYDDAPPPVRPARPEQTHVEQAHGPGSPHKAPGAPTQRPAEQGGTGGPHIRPGSTASPAPPSTSSTPPGHSPPGSSGPQSLDPSASRHPASGPGSSEFGAGIF